MSTTTTTAGRQPLADERELPDELLLSHVVEAVQSAGRLLMGRFSTTAELVTPAQVVTAIHDNDAASLAILRPMLARVRPGAQWVDDELEDGALPAGEWWVTDPVEGNINHIHGLPDWGVTATLVRDNEPVLTVVYLPLSGVTYTAVRGHGAFQDGVRLRVSSKTQLEAALVGTGQASPRETDTTFELIGRSVHAMLRAALVVHVSVPATLQLIDVAAGRMDAFWQPSAVRSGLLAGALLVAEAGGTVTDLDGRPWSLTSTDFLAASPAIHPLTAAALAGIR